MKSSYDLWSLFIVAVSVATHVIGLHLSLGWWSFPLVFLSSIFVFMAYHVNHNQMHLSIFNWGPLNWIVNGFLSIAIATPVGTLYIPHLVNHHPNYCNEKDWTGRHMAGNTRGLFRILRYNTAVMLSFIASGRAISLRGLPKPRKYSALFEVIFLLGFVIWAIMNFSISVILLHFVLPTFIGLHALIFMNFFVHDGCDPEVRLKSCRTFYSFVPNFLTVNNGYHLAHHEFPTEHWSRLPEIHKKNFAPIVEEKYMHSSALTHFYVHYVLGRPFE